MVNENRAEQLQFLRFLSFFMIFLWHAEAWAFSWFPHANGSAEAVSFFFILSGLATGYSSFSKEIDISWQKIISHIIKKLKKLYPLYFVTTIFTISYSGLAMYIANHDIVNIKAALVQLFKNLFLIQSWFQQNYFSYNGVGWFLSSIMYCYFLNVPLLACGTRIRHKKNNLFIFISIFILICGATVLYCWLLRDTNMEFWEYIFPVARSGEYVLGIVSGYIVRLLSVKIPDIPKIRRAFTFVEIASLFVWIFAMYLPFDEWKFRIIHWLFPNLFLLYAFALGKGYISRIFSMKYFRGLGNISFECFLIHQIVIFEYQVNSGINAKISGWGNIFSICFCLAITILFSYMAKNFELPVCSDIKKKLLDVTFNRKVNLKVFKYK